MECHEINDLLFEYFEGQLAGSQKVQFESHLRDCAHCKIVFYQYQQICSKLDQLSQLECPDTIINNVAKQIEQSDENLFSKLIERLHRKIYWQISIATTFAIIIIILLIFHDIPKHNKVIQAEYSTEEIEQAKKEAELAFAYFQFYTKKTETIIEQQILPAPIRKPITNTIKKAIKPLINGGNL